MKNFLRKWFRIGERISYYLTYVAMLFTLVIMLLMFIDAMLGLIFDYRILGVYEVVQVLECVYVFIAWSYTQANKGHIHVTIFISRFPQKLRFICYGTTCLISLVTMAFAFVGAYQGCLEKYENGEQTGTLLIPYWPLYLFMMIAYVLFIYLLIEETIRGIAAIFNKEIAEDVTAEWV